VPEGSEFAASLYAAINARDREAIRALTDPDIEVRTTVEAHHGQDALLTWLDEGDDAFEGFTIDVLEVEEHGGQVIVSMRQCGRGKASGAEVEDHITHVWTLRNGRATTLHSFADQAEALRHARISRLYAELANGRLSDDVLARFLDPEVEWLAVEHSPLADSYRGFAGVRRFWSEFLSAWESYEVEPLSLEQAGDRLAVVVHIVGRTHGLEVDETRSSLLTFRAGRVVRVESFADPDAAREALAGPT
jgi:ketosteroid isomerase-like protein